MNETNFRIGCGWAQIVITLNLKKSLCMMNSNNRDYITSVKCVNSTGKIISPMLIISKVNIFHKWCQKNDLDEDTLIETSDTGYSNDNLTMDWLHHFIYHTRKRQNNNYILLIVDKFKLHATILFFELVTANNIILFRLSVWKLRTNWILAV